MVSMSPTSTLLHSSSSRSSHVGLYLDLVGCYNLRLLLRGVVFRVDFEEVIEDDEKHGCASEEDRERVKLGVCDHLGG
jgi:hypothetical protein